MDKKIVLLFVKKRGTQADKFYEMFTNNMEVSLKDLKKIIARSSFHEIVKNELFQINSSLNEINEKIILFEFSLIAKNGTTFKSIKKNPALQIIPTMNHFVLKLEIENKNGE